MTKTELWDIYVAQNPSFAGPSNITLTPSGLRKLFNTTWDEAFKSGTPSATTTPNYHTDIPDLFKDIFTGPTGNN